MYSLYFPNSSATFFYIYIHSSLFFTYIKVEFIIIIVVVVNAYS